MPAASLMRWDGRGAVLAAAIVGLAASPRPDHEAQMAAQLHQAEQQRAAGLAAAVTARAAAAAAQAREDQLARDRIAAAARLREAENATEAAANRMAQLADQRREAERRLAQQSANLGPLLPLIERLALYPLETLLAIPAPPAQTLRGVTVLQGITHDMERQAEALTREQAQVATLTAQMHAAAPALAAAEQDQASEAAALDAAIDQARAMVTTEQRHSEQAARDAAAAASRASTLRGVIAAIEAARARAEAEARAEAAAAAHGRHRKQEAAARARLAALNTPAGPGLGAPLGAIGAPVAGAVIRRFGDQTDAGPAEGISYQPAPAARVVAPCGGTVLFAGPFRSYGRLLIVDCGGGDDFVLAGLDRLDVPVGGRVRQGEPVGVMPSWDPGQPGARPALYVELRHGGSAVDPAPFLRKHG